MMRNKSLIVVAGPTAVGKTDFAIKLANHYNSEIISADSRQFYEGMKIGTAAPTVDELKKAKHHFVGNLQLYDYFNVSMFEQQALDVIYKLFIHNDKVILTGGSGLYINALCYGIDDFPDANISLRKKLIKDFEKKGLEWLQKIIQEKDPEYYKIVDIKNPKRLLRALEVCLATGKTYSEQRTASKKDRDFNIIKIALNLPREKLFSRINSRVDKMIESGLIDEVKKLQPFQMLNSLNTVGYKEIFEYLDQKITLDQAIEKIKTNTRRYAKRQITWFKKDTDFHWFNPNQLGEAIELIDKNSGHVQ